MALYIKGKLKQINEIEEGTSKAGKEWKKLSFVIDTGDEYNPDVCFTCFGDDKIHEITGKKVGMNIAVDFNLSSREFNGKWYHNLDAWKVAQDTTVVEEPVEPIEGDDESDLPF